MLVALHIISAAQAHTLLAWTNYALNEMFDLAVIAIAVVLLCWTFKKPTTEE
jgi:hypothetical protein